MTERKKSASSIKLVVLASLVATGCDYDPVVEAQRDVYTKMEDCVADWGDTKLCQQMADSVAAEAKQATAGSGTTVIHPYPYFYGPTYYGGNRVAYLDSQGTQMMRPNSNRAANLVSTSVRSSTLPSHITRGGFGSTARSVSSSGRTGVGG